MCDEYTTINLEGSGSDLMRRTKKALGSEDMKLEISVG
jgi:hypothetical protein